MIIYNTTFHIDPAIHDQFISWLKNDYIPAAQKDGLNNPLLTRILAKSEDGSLTYALHLYADNLSTAAKWSSGQMPAILSDAYKKWGEKMLPFSTPMELIEL